MRYIYGPVKSRRLGNSLGITTVEYKTCCFDCVYCQLGRSKEKIIEQKEYIAISDIITELKEFLKQREQNAMSIDYITLSGFGEPTLNINIGQLIDNIKKLTSISMAVLTNSALFVIEEVRRQLLQADLVCPSLDAASQEIFEKISRPITNIKITDIISGLRAFRSEFKGKIFLEIMLIRDINDSIAEAEKIAEAIRLIMPDRVYLNIPKRYVAEKDVKLPEIERLEEIKTILGGNCEILS
jgi:wyosine [tRNA(Phe)-imidazoG37] synthetase (radical SAM superfamily)